MIKMPKVFNIEESKEYISHSPPSKRKMIFCVIIVNTSDGKGGAARSATLLHHECTKRGLESFVAVKIKTSTDPRVVVFPHEAKRNLFSRTILGIADWLKKSNKHFRGFWRLSNGLLWLAEPKRQWDIYSGKEDFSYPATWNLLELFPFTPNIIHCHNLHGGYFDLRALPWLTQQVPVLITLHDAWLLSGHCAHSFDCDRWKTGCGNCPDLSIYPAVQRDATSFNWARKKDIFSRSRLYVASPSQWLLNRAKQSILSNAIVESRVIPNGVDLATFRPATDRRAVRASLGIPERAKVLLFAANGIKKKRWRDFEMLQKALYLVGKGLTDDNVLFIALGEKGKDEHIGRATIRFVEYQSSTEIVSKYYQASDLYVHPAIVDNFPNVVLEALACGTPVVATSVGGIPEQVKGLKGLSTALDAVKGNCHEIENATGVLTPRGDAVLMAESILMLLQNEPLRARMAVNAVKDSKDRFDLTKTVDAYINWYLEIVNKHEQDN